ncbi:MAG: PAS domain-containing protein, partial [Comamonas sp.]
MHKDGAPQPTWPYWILALYTLTAVLWLAGSERLLLQWAQDAAQVARWKDSQGYISIFLNALMAGWLLHRLLRAEAVRRADVLRRAALRRQEEERQRLAATVVDNTIEGVIVTDANSRILSVNAAFTRLLGYTEQEMLGQTPRMFKSGRHGQAFYEAMWDSMQRTGHWQGEIWNQRKNGEVFPERMSLSAVHDSANRVTHYVCMFTDISAEKAQQQRLEYLARKDPLTGLD